MMRKIFFLFCILILFVTTGYISWLAVPLEPLPETQDTMTSNDLIEVTINDWHVFQPTMHTPKTGLIFYPGARIDAQAYSPAAQVIAAQGFLVVVVPMPLNLALLGPDRAMAVINEFSEIEHWVVGGHSLGGAQAGLFAQDHLDVIDGLVLWGAYPTEDNNLSVTDIEVTAIFGTRDGLVTPDEIEAARLLLPSTTEWVFIEGGNHAQFGWYGEQQNDLPATIGLEVQQWQATDATVELLQRVEEN
ncbi:MAG: alpha/beta hydrolase [Chloroflexi bacterium AL-W]|nr:alpha/beta hydrolase [Chloroflexi bacterium AL-N1]NOK65361.1 alpha/beta hydrolase [Chloroflexi bacterium AL-N10]NOK72373.1 alpha/beta hydrolase [Chloroflexi bacterium AL-N5]NOK79540.1 alpha/beta hydrolase [Chloroflexi bacterium AL-W]NOK87456.1 alpha/beta hydrolase [Chloroflexi bacterium AL-N15]